jgi:hypothetical protein
VIYFGVSGPTSGPHRAGLDPPVRTHEWQRDTLRR